MQYIVENKILYLLLEYSHIFWSPNDFHDRLRHGSLVGCNVGAGFELLSHFSKYTESILTSQSSIQQPRIKTVSHPCLTLNLSNYLP